VALVKEAVSVIVEALEIGAVLGVVEVLAIGASAVVIALAIAAWVIAQSIAEPLAASTVATHAAASAVAHPAWAAWEAVVGEVVVGVAAGLVEVAVVAVADDNNPRIRENNYEIDNLQFEALDSLRGHTRLFVFSVIR
jgi:hypothetical protein